MKTAIGGISIFQLVIIFVLLFTGIMCLTINHAKAFTVKDSIINVIEATEYNSGIDHNEISKLLIDAGYRITGKNCPSGWMGYDREGKSVSRNVSYCIKENDVTDTFYNDARDKCKNNKCKVADINHPKMYYYDVMVFYQLDIPGLNQVMNFSTTSSTKILIGE